MSTATTAVPSRPAPSLPGRPTIIVDVDGTLADISGVRHYLIPDGRGRRDFERFHRAASYVRPMPLVVETVQALHSAGFASLVLTSRQEKWRRHTRIWLQKWEVPVDALGMRANEDARRDDDVKRDLFIRARRLGFDPVLAFDDNPIVIALWRKLNIPTVVVPGWDDPVRTNSEGAPL